MAGTCLSLPAGGGDRPCRSAGSPRTPSPWLLTGLSASRLQLLGPWSPLHTGPPGPPSPSCIIFAVSLQGPPFFWPGQLFRRPSPSTVLLKRFPWWSWEHTVPAKGRGPRVRPQPCGGPWEMNVSSLGPSFPISERRAGWDAGSSLPCTPPVGNDLGFCTPPSCGPHASPGPGRTPQPRVPATQGVLPSARWPVSPPP